MVLYSKFGETVTPEFSAKIILHDIRTERKELSFLVICGCQQLSTRRLCNQRRPRRETDTAHSRSVSLDLDENALGA